MGDAPTLRELNRATLARQMLLVREDAGVVEAVERLAGLQAQEPRPPFVALWARVEGFAREDLHAALDASDVVRAVLMRATLHLMSARDYAVVRPTLAPALTKAIRALARDLDLDAVLSAGRELLAERPRAFTEVRAALAERFPADDRRALGSVVRSQLPLAMVPTGDRWAFPRDSAFRLADDGLGEPDLEGLVRRYLAAFGPATLKDMQTWGVPVKAAQLGDMELEQDGSLYDVAGAPRPGEDAEAPPRLLGDFDNLVLAHADRTRIVADEHRPKLTTKNLRVRATFLVDGFVAGTWTAQRKGRTATLALEPFAKVARRDAAALTEEADRLIRFLEPDAGSFDVRLG